MGYSVAHAADTPKEFAAPKGIACTVMKSASK
jgi:hypothetical protein